MANRKHTPESVQTVLTTMGITLRSSDVVIYGRAEFECQCGDIWSAVLGSVLRGDSGCPSCAKAKPVYIYVIKVAQGITKIGISSRPDKRLRSMMVESGYEMKICATFLFDDGSRKSAKHFERYAHVSLSEFKAETGVFAGHTECFSIGVRKAINLLTRMGGLRVKMK